jgi:hypothetical protein
MSTKDLLGMLFERGNAMQTLWGFYITVSATLLAFFGSAQRSRIVAVVLSIAFVAFAYVNGKGIHDIGVERQALFQILRASPPDGSNNDLWSSAPRQAKLDLVNASEPPTPCALAAFHFAGDVTVLIALWLLTLLPRESDLFKGRSG